MTCDFAIIQSGSENVFTCRRCGRVVRSKSQNYIGRCRVTGEAEQPDTCGAGCQLSKLLKKFGFEYVPGCKCKSRAAEMDRNGAEWCRENMPTILGWMREEAERRGLPFIELAARQLVKLAIRRAEKEST